MQLAVDETILEETTRCHRNFACLANNDNVYCEVEKCMAGRILIMKSLTREYCNYRMFFGHSYVICDCPTRREIYKKYNL